MNIPLSEIIDFMERTAPGGSALPWDNSGLQVGDPRSIISGVTLALDMCPAVLEEALDCASNLIITHHPLIFSPLRSIDFSTPAGKMIKNLIAHEISLFSAHTNLDRSPTGTGRILAERMGLSDIKQYTDNPDDEMNMVVTGTYDPPKTGGEIVDIIKKDLGCPSLRSVGNIRKIATVAIIPGSGGSLLRKIHRPFDLIITGELSYHDALTSSYRDQPVIIPGHFVTEKPVMFFLAEKIKEKFPDLAVNVAKNEGEPYRIL